MKTKQPELNKITALYERLSRDDELSGDSNRYYKSEENVGEICNRAGICQPTSLYG